MIIWGSYVMNKVVKSGNFHCPNCNTQQPYQLLLPRKWGHLYWIPLIPMENFDQHVACGKCQKTYKEVVLDYDPVGDKLKFNTAMSKMIGHAMTLMATAANLQTSPDRVALTIKQILGTEPEPMVLAQSLAPVEPQAALEIIKQNANGLNPVGKEMLLRAALSGVDFSQATRARAQDIGTGLGMTPAHINGVLAEVAGST